MIYDLYDRNYKQPAMILKTLKREYPKPSDFMNACNMLLSKIRKDQEERKQKFLELVSQELEITTEQVIQKGKEIFQKYYEDSEHERIAGMEKANEKFRESQEQSGSKGIQPFPNEIIEQEKESLTARVHKRVQEVNDWDILNALRMNLKISGIETAMKDWEDAWGFANALEYEIAKRPESALPYNNITNHVESDTSPIESSQSEKKDLPFTNLTDVTVWQLEHEFEIGKLTDEEFARRYTYKRGHAINPKSLRMARTGTGQYKKSALEVLEERKRHKENSERKK